MKKRVKGTLELTYEYHGKIMQIRIPEAGMVLTESKTLSKQEGKKEEDVFAFEILIPGIIPAAVEIGDAPKENENVTVIY